MKFFPIETCPKDRSHVILRSASGWGSSMHRLDEGFYDPDHLKSPWRDHQGDAWSEGGSAPTHWAPLVEIELSDDDKQTFSPLAVAIRKIEEDIAYCKRERRCTEGDEQRAILVELRAYEQCLSYYRHAANASSAPKE